MYSITYFPYKIIYLLSIAYFYKKSMVSDPSLFSVLKAIFLIGYSLNNLFLIYLRIIKKHFSAFILYKSNSTRISLDLVSL